MGETITTVRMSKGEAELAWRTIRFEMGKAIDAEGKIGKALLSLKDGEGWKHLGFKSFEECVRAIQKEYGLSRSTVFRRLNIARAHKLLYEANVIAGDETVTIEQAELINSMPEEKAIEAVREARRLDASIRATLERTAGRRKPDTKALTPFVADKEAKYVPTPYVEPVHNGSEEKRRVICPHCGKEF